MINNNYSDTSEIREYLIDLKEIENFNTFSFKILNEIVFDYLFANIYLILNYNNDMIVLEIDSYGGDLYFEWPYDVEMFDEFTNILNINNMSKEETVYMTEEDEIIIFERLLKLISSKRPPFKSMMAKEYNLK